MIKFFKALSDLNRLRIVSLLIEAEKLCVCELEVLLGMTQSNASRHLAKLRDAGIVETVKNAQWVYYKVSDQFIDQNNLLYNYVKGATSEDQLSIDIERYRLFKEKNLTCMDIRESKESVEVILES